MLDNLFKIWTDKYVSKYRKNLLEGKRCNSPCTECNAEGTVLGYKHAEAWRKIYKLNEQNHFNNRRSRGIDGIAKKFAENKNDLILIIRKKTIKKLLELGKKIRSMLK